MIYLCFAVAGLSVGHFQGVAQKNLNVERKISSINAQDSINSYDHMVCLSEEEYRASAERVKLDVPKDLKICADPNHGRLAKLFSFASKVQFHFPKYWAPELQEDMRDPLGYLGKMCNRMEFDFSLTTTFAQNTIFGKNIQLGGEFFTISPLEALTYLVHEARHSSDDDPRHVICRRGDIPRAGGGCDQELSISSANAGAYSYEAMFGAALGLYADGLSKGDKEFMLSSSLAVIGTRFNVLPAPLAQTTDMLTVLDQDGGVSILHPLTKKLIPFDMPFLKEGEKVVHIDANIRGNGILFFTDKNHMYSWTRRDGYERYDSEIIPEDMPIYYAARMRIPEDDYPYYHFLSNKNKIYYDNFDENTLKYTLSENPLGKENKDTASIPDWKMFFLALSEESVFLDRGGAFYLGAKYDADPSFTRRDDLQIKGKTWTYGTGGVVYESLYGIASDGRVYQASLNKSADDAPFVTPFYTMQETKLQAGNGLMAVKFLEGVNFRVILDNQSFLHFEFYQNSEQHVWGQLQGKKIVDMALLRQQHTGKQALPISYSDEQFTQGCNIRKSLDDPWFSRGIGLDASGHFVVAGTKTEPCLYPLGDKVFAGARWVYKLSQGTVELIDRNMNRTVLEPYGFEQQ